ncbi:hypothetical protein LZ554_001357 [Drepanopeziza brunnea f. sp. 'monogermtubi']|nr:hypothetical protein LZ554_001357 [Drepanopeziza brunnea f. sp. 'monogermtubi']
MPPTPKFNVKTLTMPLAAFTMATLLFVYTRTSIAAAKRNAQRHRDADGGQINWHNENLRRHGRIETPGEGSTVAELLGTLKGAGGGAAAGRRSVEGEGEEASAGGETEAERRIGERKRGG